MTDKEKKLAAGLLKLAADTFANHGCNDIDDELLEGWTEEERQNLMRDYEMVNSHGRDYEEGDEIHEDWIAMLALAYKLEGKI
jgi:hypothetical protein